MFGGIGILFLYIFIKYSSLILLLTSDNWVRSSPKAFSKKNLILRVITNIKDVYVLLR